MAITIAASSSYTPVGTNQPANTTGCTVPLPSGYTPAIGDYVIEAGYFAQATGATTEIAPTGGWVRVPTDVGTSANRMLALYEYKITNSAALAAFAPFAAKVGSAATRFVGQMFILKGVDLTAATAISVLDYGATSSSSYNAPSQPTGGMRLWFMGTNTSSPSTGSAFTPSAGYIALASRSTDVAGTPTADSQLITFVGTPSATSAAATANHVSYQLGFTTLAANAAPTAAFTTTSNALSVTANASTSTDSDGTVASYAWTWGDGATSTGVSPTHAYSAGGSYTIGLTVTDNNGLASSQVTKSVTVSAGGNSIPVPKFTIVGNGNDVSVNGSSSTDSDGTITGYAWDFGDGTTATGQVAFHTYATAATRNITLTVTDNSGATATLVKSSTTPYAVTPHFHNAVPGDYSQASTGAGTSITLAKPTNLTDGDVLFAFIYNQATSGNQFTAPTGWVLDYALVSRRGGIYHRVITSADTEAQNYTWSNAGSGRIIGTLIRATGVNRQNPIDVVGTELSADASALTTLTLNGLTTIQTNDLIVSWAWWNNSSTTQLTTITPASGFTEVIAGNSPTGGANNPSGVEIANVLQASATATGTKALTQTPAGTLSNGLLFALAPAAVVAPVANIVTSQNLLSLTVDGSNSTSSSNTVVNWAWNFGDSSTASGATPAAHTYAAPGTYTVTLTVTDSFGLVNTTTRSVTVVSAVTGRSGIYRTPDGVNHTGKMFYFDGNVKHMIRAPKPFYAPYTVAMMKAEQVWIGLHRGGSVNYPEEVMKGYRACAQQGAKILEVSVWQTNDTGAPQFVCSHDQNLSRVTGTSLDIPTSSLAAAKALTVKPLSANLSQPAQPVMELRELLNAFSSTHVIIAEMKAGTLAAKNALLDLLDSYGTVDRPANQRFVIKSDALGSKAAFFDNAIARGYETWGYIFDASMSANLTAAIAKTTMLGLDYNSSDATLTAAIAQCIAAGVRPTAHIIPTAAIRDRMIGLGMRGLMVSNILAIPPLTPAVTTDPQAPVAVLDPTPAAIASETWTGTTGNAWPAQWTITSTLGAGGSATIQGNAGQLNAGTTAGGSEIALMSGAPITSDTDITVSVTLPNNGYTVLSINAGLAGQYSPDEGYSLIIFTYGGNSGGYVLTRRHGGAETQKLVDYVGVTFPTAGPIKFRLRRVGTKIQFKYWDASLAEPVAWSQTATDTTGVAATGQVRLAIQYPGSGGVVSPVVLFDNLTVAGTTVSDAPMPTADVVSNGTTWRNVYAEDFNTPSALGQVRTAYSPTIKAYPENSGGLGKYKFDANVSVSNGIMNLHAHNIGGVDSGAAMAIPQANGDWGWVGGRFQVRFRADLSAAGYGAAFQLWPSSDTWSDGEMDFPEGDFGGQINMYHHQVGANPEVNYTLAQNLGYWKDWHIATTEWVPGVSVRYYLDGTLIGSVTNPAQVATARHNYIIQCASHATDTSAPDTADGYLQVDWITIAQPITVAQSAPADDTLFFQKSTAVPTKLVFAHYFGPYPRSIDNANGRANDSYTTAYINPTYSTYAKYGGWHSDRHIYRDPIGTNFKIEDAKQQVLAARQHGVDGFVCDMLGLSGTNYDNYDALVTAVTQLNAAGSLARPFYVVPMIDGNGATGLAAPADAANAIYNQYYNKASTWTISGQGFVVTSFAGEKMTAAWWTAMRDALVAKGVPQVALMIGLLNFGSASTYSAISMGEGTWGGGDDPAVINAGSNQTATAHGRGKTFMAPVGGQQIRRASSLYDESANTAGTRAYWEKAINDGADYIQMVTWSDFSEGTTYAPSEARGYAPLKVAAWYIEKFHTGSYPTILKDEIILSHRSNKLGSGHTLSTQTVEMAQWNRGMTLTPPQDTVEVLTFLTASATVSVVIGGVTKTYTAPAGMYSQKYPLVVGAAPSVSVTRSGAVTAQVTSLVPVVATPLRDDKQYFWFSAIQGTAGQRAPVGP